MTENLKGGGVCEKKNYEKDKMGNQGFSTKAFENPTG